MKYSFGVFILQVFFAVANLWAGEVGSISIFTNQRFFENASLRNVNGQSPWGAIHIQVESGLSEIFKIEPIVGFGMIKNSSSSATGQFDYQIYTGILGARYRPWNYNYFWLTPYIELNTQTHYVRGRNILAGVQDKLAHGIDLAFCAGGGVFFSFMYDQQRKDDLASEWEVTDFGLLAGMHYSRSGFIEKGDAFNILNNLNYWDFGLGLLIDW